MQQLLTALVLASVLFGTTLARAEEYRARHHRHHSVVQKEPTEPDKPNEEDQYVRQEYGKHIGPDSKVPPTPNQKKAEKALREGH